MNSHRIRRTLATILAFSATASLAEECPTVIRFAFSDAEAPPYFNGRGSDLANPPGLAIEWAITALNNTRCRPAVQMTRLPAKRLERAIADSSQDITIAGPTPERLNTLQFPLKDGSPDRNFAIVRGELSLYGLKKNASRWTNGVLAPDTRVGVVRGYATEALAKQRGWTHDVSHDNESNFSKLMLERIDLVLSLSILADPILGQAKVHNVEKLSPPVMQFDLYSPVSKQFFAKYPGFTQEYWRNICKESLIEKTKQSICKH